MTTSRKPVQPPKPKITRPLAQPDQPKNPITTEIMQRVRRVISQSNDTLSIRTVASDIDVNPSKMREWIACWRSAPYGDNLIKIVRWLALHDPTFIPEVIERRSVRFRGEVESIQARKLSDLAVSDIRSSDEPVTVLAKRHDVHHTTIRKIRDGQRH